MNLKPTINDEIFFDCMYTIVAKYIIIATLNASSRKNKAFLNIYEGTDTLVNIFRIIRPLLVV